MSISINSFVFCTTALTRIWDQSPATSISSSCSDWEGGENSARSIRIIFTAYAPSFVVWEPKVLPSSCLFVWLCCQARLSARFFFFISQLVKLDAGRIDAHKTRERKLNQGQQRSTTRRSSRSSQARVTLARPRCVCVCDLCRRLLSPQWFLFSRLLLFSLLLCVEIKWVEKRHKTFFSFPIREAFLHPLEWCALESKKFFFLSLSLFPAKKVTLSFPSLVYLLWA
jgi:hypothetical protein